MNKHFTHLHLHTDYSLLDGAITIDRLIKFGQEQKSKALAITDHGNIFGAVEFFQKCKKAGIKPILGIEAYFTEDVSQKTVENKYYHLIILVQNTTGYKNLCRLISYSFREGFYFKPRIDYKTLEQYSEGLIVTTACLGGHIPKLLAENKYEEVHKRIDWFLKVFGPDRFYLEVQPDDTPEQKALNEKLYKLADERSLNLVAAGDCHYPTLDDREAHEVMLCAQTHAKLTDPNRFTFGNCRTYMRSQEEMLELFKDHEAAVWNSGKIADMCDFSFETDKLHFPKFNIPEPYTESEYFRHLCQKGFDELYTNEQIPIDQKNLYQDRLLFEMDLIEKMGYISYMLIVGDFIQWAKQQDIPVGPGRGSVAGSLVAWALKITNIDPLKYTLLFERFLNPERVSMPDIDIDFCVEGREKVIQYVKDKYGHDNVCQIITFGTMMAKGVIKDVARVLDMPFEDANTLTDLIPNQLNITLKEAKEQEPRLKQLIEDNPQVARLFSIAERLEGLTRHASKHAAGIVISPEPVDTVLPIYIPPKTDEIVTQYAMTSLETIGFLKIDFLGLKTLTHIQKTVQLIKHNHGIDILIDTIPLDDQKTFALLCAGNTAGVFQFESSGLKEVLRKLQPQKFEDLIAVNALYRPGPLGSGMIDDFIARRHGRQKITYIVPEVASILEETYGVIVYQEQVMKIASAVAGYSLGEADILRKAMGKKKIEVMAEQEEIFVKKSVDRNVNPKKAKELFDLMAYFAGYGFNKAHAAAYAIMIYQTAYLKANYPSECMAVLISLEMDHAEKMTSYLEEAKDMGIKIFPPDINQSKIVFDTTGESLLFGLQGIKSVGAAALNTIIEERHNGPFESLFDLCTRVDLRTVNKRVLEHLIYAGALDKVPGNRAQKIAELSLIMDQAVAYKNVRETGQIGIFGATLTPEQQKNYIFQPLPEFSDTQKLEKEKEIIGFYVTAHPLDQFKKTVQYIQTTDLRQAKEQLINFNSEKEIPITCFGMVRSKRTITTKKGDPMAFVQIEDYTGTAELVIFPSLLKKAGNLFDQHNVFFVKGTIDSSSGTTCKILVKELVPLELIFQEQKLFSRITFTLPESPSEEIFETLKKVTKGNWELHILFEEQGKKLKIKTQKKVFFDPKNFEQFEQLALKVMIN